ncbi:MAG TPA: hypothetical protein VGJ60_37120 [Chloroflexota bacterium]
MAEQHNPVWRAMASRGFADLSPPEAEHAMLELPTNRADYVGVLQDLGDYPARSPIGHRVPSQAEVEALQRDGGPWRGVVLLEDDRAARHAALLFDRVFVLDPFFDSGALLYAAWHDPYIKDEHSRRLAEHTGWLVRLAPLFNAGSAVLAPDHLPGSWNPRPGWRRPRRNADRRQVAAWAMRSGLVLLYWADRLDAVACATRPEVGAAMDVVLGLRAASVTLELADVSSAEEAQRLRDEHAAELCEQWREMRRLSRRRPTRCLDDLVYLASRLPVDDAGDAGWRLALGQASVPEPSMLIRRVLNGEDPERLPALPRRQLKRRPLCLLGAER